MSNLHKLLLGFFFLIFANNARADTIFGFDFSGDGITGHGTFSVSGNASPYTVSGIAGTINGHKITGVSGYASADNLLHFPDQPFVDYRGIAFSTDGAGNWSIGYNGSSYGIINSVDNPTGDCCGPVLTNFGISPPETPSDSPPSINKH